MRAEIKFFCNNLKPDSGIKWETPIAHLIPRTPFATTIGDSLLEGAGGFSIALFWTTYVTEDPHLVLLNITNNASALSWTLHTCKRSRIGRLLACFFCSLLINSPLGINLQWISTNDNKITDDISCLK
jgi:hypothetical protein